MITKEMISEKWDMILSIMQSTYGVSNIIAEIWIRPLTPYHTEEGIVRFHTNKSLGEYGVTFIKNKGYDVILKAVLAEAFDVPEILVTIDPISNVESYTSDAVEFTEEYNYKKSIQEMNLMERLTFENFIVGDTNKMAYVTCTAVADLPGQDHLNPLFIYGESGVGKTHLLQAIALYILKNNPKVKVLYVPAEIFISEIITALQEKTMPDFKEKYRKGVDVLIIDDIQEIIGKQATQAEFFNTFNYLYSQNKQIVLSSDKPPSEMKTLEERLKSRFEWGIPIDIHAPDYETRMAILHSKASSSNLKEVPEEVFDYIAENIVSNVRTLESALHHIQVYQKMQSIDYKEITVDVAKNILIDLINKDSKAIVTPDTIMNVVAEHLNVSVDDIKSKKRTKDIAQARQIVMYLCRMLTDKGLKDIGEALGGKNHSTVISGIKNIEKRVSEDPTFDSTIHIIINKIGL